MGNDRCTGTCSRGHKLMGIEERGGCLLSALAEIASVDQQEAFAIQIIQTKTCILQSDPAKTFNLHRQCNQMEEVVLFQQVSNG